MKSVRGLRAFLNVVCVLLMLGQLALVSGCRKRLTYAAGVSSGGVLRVEEVLRSHQIDCAVESTTRGASIFVSPDTISDVRRLLSEDSKRNGYRLWF
jgi:hypothetical protein